MRQRLRAMGAESPLISAKNASRAAAVEIVAEVEAVVGALEELAGVREVSLSSDPAGRISRVALSAARSRIFFNNFAAVNSEGGPNTSAARSMHNSTAFMSQALSTNSIMLATLNLGEMKIR